MFGIVFYGPFARNHSTGMFVDPSVINPFLGRVNKFCAVHTFQHFAVQARRSELVASALRIRHKFHLTLYLNTQCNACDLYQSYGLFFLWSNVRRCGSWNTEEMNVVQVLYSLPGYSRKLGVVGPYRILRSGALRNLCNARPPFQRLYRL